MKNNTKIDLVDILAEFSIIVDSEGIVREVCQENSKEFPVIENSVINNLNIQDILININLKKIFPKAIKYNQITFQVIIRQDTLVNHCLLTVKHLTDGVDDRFLLTFKYFFENKLINNPVMHKLHNCIMRTTEILGFGLDFYETIELVFKKLKEVIQYDLALLMFLDVDRLVIKSSNNTEVYNLPSEIPLSDTVDFNEFVKFNSSVILKEKISSNILAKALKIEWAKEIVISPLLFKESSFGLLLLANKEEKEYHLEDLIVLDRFAAMAAYALKNAELTNILRSQLKYLRDNLIERAQALEDIKSKQKESMEVDKLKDEFISNISHELRTPLNTIITYSEALKMKIFGDLNMKQEEYLNDIHTSGIHLLGMVNDILNISRMEDNEIELNISKFSIELAINEAINFILPLAQAKGIEIIEKFNHSTDTIKADQRKYQQIIHNVISNAIKFSPDKTVVYVESNDGELEGKPAIELSIKDDGIGIIEADQEKIFQKFQQLDMKPNRSHGGSGLGLTIVRQFVEMHNGKITVESKAGKGSTFRIYIPYRD